jgi:hypothetical protein
MNTILILFFLFVVLELLETSWQKAQDLYGVIYNNYAVYQRSFFTFLLLNSTFFYTLFLTIYLNSDSLVLYLIVFVKFIDLFFKISMMKKLSDGQKLEDIMPMNAKLGFIFRYMNVVLYPLAFLFATGYL